MNSVSASISHQLAALGPPASFATRFSLDTDPRLEVDGVGPVSLPVTVAMAHRLCAVAEPAQHGYKDETRYDPKVRDTWEIPADRIRLTEPGWPTTLERALDRIRGDLGLPARCRLRTELHNLLVYAPGQFFKVHRDSEKADGMLGTLVVTLPSGFKGGDFVVSHQGQAVRARGSSSRLNLIAFYADCCHEVRPVTQGYRIVLTYNLVAEGDQFAAPVPAEAIEPLADAVRTFWNTPAPPRWQGDHPQSPPDRLVYLLDYQYTARSLSWNRLKGADGARAAALRAVAQRLDAAIFLALADVHETWSTEYEPDRRRRWSYHDEDEEEDDDGAIGGGDEPALSELIESEIELRHWLAPDSATSADSASTGVDEAELCFTVASVELQPFQSEHEGYLGNYGNTADRWYHRAAVVLWPRARSFLLRAKHSPAQAMGEIAALLAAGDLAQSQANAASLLPFWQTATRSADRPTLLASTATVAAVLDDADTAAALLDPFSLTEWTPELATQLVHLLDRYGPAWCQARVQGWTSADLRADALRTWLASTLPALALACDANPTVDTRNLLGALLDYGWNWLGANLRQRLADPGPTPWPTVTWGTRSRPKETSDPCVSFYREPLPPGRLLPPQILQALMASVDALWALIAANRIGQRAGLLAQIIETLKALPIQIALGVLRAAKADASSSPSELAELHAWCQAMLAVRLARVERQPDDWSIQLPINCMCELCKSLAAFLAAPERKWFEWPLAEAKRRHIHDVLNRYQLPVCHITRRSGRPYTLVLEKTDELHEHEASERRHLAAELAWLIEPENPGN